MNSVSQPSGRWLALLAATIIVLYLCWLMLLPFIDVLLWGVVLAMVAWPVQVRLRRRGHSAHVSAMLTTGVVVLTVLIPLAFVTTAVVQQGASAVNGLADGLPKLLDRNSTTFKWLDEHFQLGALLRDPAAVSAKVTAGLEAIARRTPGVIGQILGGAVGMILQVFFVLFTLYYLLRDSERIIAALRRSLPLTEANADTIFRRTGEVIGASVNGVLVISAIQGFLGMIAFLVLGVPSAVLWGVMMFLLSTIPMAGAFIVWVPAAIYLAASGRWIAALLLTIWGAGVIGMIDNVLRPRLVGKCAKLHELIIFFSVMGGLQVFGILGLFVGPVLAAIALALVDMWSGERIEKREDSSEKRDAASEKENQSECVSDPAPLAIPIAAAHRVPDKIAGSG